MPTAAEPRATALRRVTPRRTTVGLVAGGLGASSRSSRTCSRSCSAPRPARTVVRTTSRVDFGCDPGEWTDAWSASGVDHHWAMGTGHRAAELEAVAQLLGLEFAQVRG